ncbi:hypothetical protein CEV32_3335 [Brucella rhizosphaerae]|uniref:Uncharacterized protein n=1 Tax=Brucella rhizosphaerae TaxID=571254 RepID=A0A256FV81_9HYPH|nr:hypothetical protein CEV32_3335 [Brucella rhizosphaerae]
MNRLSKKAEFPPGYPGGNTAFSVKPFRRFTAEQPQNYRSGR